jgi:hypothetical protein
MEYILLYSDLNSSNINVESLTPGQMFLSSLAEENSEFTGSHRDASPVTTRT